MDPKVQQQLAKLVSVRLCPPVPGQIVLDAVVDPPQPGDPSYELFNTVRDGMEMGWDGDEMEMGRGWRRGWDGDGIGDGMGWGWR